MSGCPGNRRSEAGFTLIETLIAIVVLATGLLALAQVFAAGVTSLASGSQDLIAREKASEAVESVYTARDSRTVTWEELRNADDGGVFLDGVQPLTVAGDDGLVNTADDGEVETFMLPGADGELGSADDVPRPLTEYTREIAITEEGPNLRRIRITIRYAAGGGRREYAIETLLSAFA